jgi:hypothetical protein
MTTGGLTPLCRDPSDQSGFERADCRSACCSAARGAGDPIPVAAQCGATVAPPGADHGLRGPRDEPGPRPLGALPCCVRSMAHGSLGRRLRSRAAQFVTAGSFGCGLFAVGSKSPGYQQGASASLLPTAHNPNAGIARGQAATRAASDVPRGQGDSCAKLSNCARVGAHAQVPKVAYRCRISASTSARSYSPSAVRLKYWSCKPLLLTGMNFTNWTLAKQLVVI